mgnify:CR=1 FL=1
MESVVTISVNLLVRREFSVCGYVAANFKFTQ